MQNSPKGGSKFPRTTWHKDSSATGTVAHECVMMKITGIILSLVQKLRFTNRRRLSEPELHASPPTYLCHKENILEVDYNWTKKNKNWIQEKFFIKAVDLPAGRCRFFLSTGRLPKSKKFKNFRLLAFNFQNCFLRFSSQTQEIFID